MNDATRNAGETAATGADRCCFSDGNFLSIWVGLSKWLDAHPVGFLLCKSHKPRLSAYPCYLNHLSDRVFCTCSCSKHFAFPPSCAYLLFATGSKNTLIDLAGLDVTSTSTPPVPPTTLTPAPTAAPVPAEIPILPPPPQTFSQLRSSSLSQVEAAPTQQSSTANSLSLLDEELLCLGKTLRGLEKGNSIPA